MNDKQKTLIELGVELMATQGYHRTSIQQIADKAGISKGAFYLYFDSKESFIATAYEYFYGKITRRLEAIQQEDLSPKQSLARQINVVTESVIQYKSIIMMNVRENIAIGKRMERLAQDIKWYNFKWLRDQIVAIHGEKVNDYLLDCIIQFEGLMTGYFKAIVIDHVQLNIHNIGPFLVERLDDMVEGMVRKDAKPLMSSTYRKTFDQCVQQQSNEQTTVDILYRIKDKIKTLSIDRARRDELYEVVDSMINKVNEDPVRKIVLQGLIVHLQRFPELKALCDEFANAAQIDLIDLSAKNG